MGSKTARQARQSRRRENGVGALASFKNPPVSVTETTRYLFKPHQSIRQRLRNLRQRCRPVLQSQDPEVQIWGHTIIREVASFDIPEYRALCLIAQALDYVDSTGVTFPQAAEVIVDKILEAKAERIREASTHIGHAEAHSEIGTDKDTQSG